jgi:hypothetical protein
MREIYGGFKTKVKVEFASLRMLGRVLIAKKKPPEGGLVSRS